MQVTGKVVDWMSANVLSSTKDESVQAVAIAMRDHGIGSIVVVDESMTPVGIVTSSDLVNKVLASNLRPESTLIEQVMSTTLVVGRPDDSMHHAATLMEQHKIKKLIITDEDGKLAGVLTTTDINRFCSEADESQDDVDRLLKKMHY